MAPMALSDSEVTTCSKSCLKNYETLKKQYDDLRIELNQSEFNLANYKRGLASVEERLVFYKKNEGMLCDQIVVLKRDASFNESEINALKIQIERLKKEKESNQIKIDNFVNASKSLDKLIGSQISDNNRKGVGYNAVAPPPTGLFAPLLLICQTLIKKTTGAPLIEDWFSDCDEDEIMEKVTESANVQKPKQADQPRKVSQNPRNNTVLTKSGLVPISTARQSSSRAAAPVITAMPIKTSAPKSFVNFVNTAKGKRVTSAIREQGINAVKSKACWVWRPKIKVLDHVSKNNKSYICRKFDYVDPTGLEFKVLVVYKKELAILGQTATGKSKEVGTLRYLSLVVPLTKVGDEAIHMELGDRMERAATTASSLEAEQDNGSGPRYQALKKKPVTVAQASGSEPFQEQSTEEPKELSEEDLKEILEIVLVEETKAEDDAARQDSIMGVIMLFEQSMSEKEDLRKQYAECKDISPERHALLQKKLGDEAWKDYKVKKALWGCV
ncbi:hypothetical protein Tco_0666114 [Tanacetum coccineum]